MPSHVFDFMCYLSLNRSDDFEFEAQQCTDMLLDFNMVKQVYTGLSNACTSKELHIKYGFIAKKKEKKINKINLVKQI